MRCLALAAPLRAAGAECVFLCRGAGLGALTARIAAAGHALLALPEAAGQAAAVADEPVLAHARWLPGGWRNDAATCLRLLAEQPAADWLVVDHYALDARWQQAMRGSAQRLLVIDDLADRRHDCDVLLDQNLVPGMVSRYDGLLPKGCLSLLGPRYALLRSEFGAPQEVATEAAEVPETARLLLMFGGADAQKLTLRSVEVLERMRWGGVVDVAVGPLYPELEALREVVARLPGGRLHAPAESVAALMHRADLAVGSPGVSSWERCACALPALAIAQADNQEPIGRALGVAGAHFYLGRAEQVSDADLEAALRLFLANAPARAAMRAAAGKICDGRGAERVARHLLAPSLAIRLAGPDDAKLLFDWRNDERTRCQSFDPRPLEWSSHLAWFEKTLANPDASVLLACHGDMPVACVRFDAVGDRARVSIYADPDLHGHGFGRAALLAALDWFRAERPAVGVVEADVLQGNAASHSLFVSAGFRPAWARYERIQERP